MNNENIIAAVKPADPLFSRNFSLTLRKEFIDNRKALLLGIVGILGFCITIGTILGFNYTGGTWGETSFYGFIALIIGCAVGSLTFSNLIHKETRISMLLVPDTMFDKFIIRWFAVVPLLFILLAIGLYFTEFSRIIVFKIVHSDEVVAASGDFCKVLNPFELIGMIHDPSGASLAANFLTFYLFSQSLYILGSVLWPKLSFIKTFAAIWVLETIASIILMTIDINIPKGVIFDGTTFFWCVAAVTFAITVVVYVLAYLRFRNYQVVNKTF